MKSKRNALQNLIMMLMAGTIYLPTKVRQKHDKKTVIYLPGVKKSKLFRKTPKCWHNDFMLFSPGTFSNFIPTVFLVVFIITGIFNISYGQSKVDILDKFTRAYAE